MCGKNYNTTSALIFHFLNEHFKYLCSNCDQYFDDVYDLEHHEHTHENVHDSEYKREKRKKFFVFDIFYFSARKMSNVSRDVSQREEFAAASD